jgi:hypothetical protein
VQTGLENKEQGIINKVGANRLFSLPSSFLAV